MLFMYMDQNKSDSLSDEEPRSRSSDGNSRAKKRPRKGKSLPISRRMTSDLDLEG